MQNSRLLARLRQRACVCEHRQGSSPKRSALWVRGGSQHHQDRARVEHLQVQPKAWFSSVCFFFFLKLVPKIKLKKKKNPPKIPSIMILHCSSVHVLRHEYLPQRVNYIAICQNNLNCPFDLVVILLSHSLSLSLSPPQWTHPSDCDRN